MSIFIFILVMVLAGLVYQRLSNGLILGFERLGKTEKSKTAENFTETDDWPFVSILVAAKDEEKNLPKLIPALLAQNYPANRFEIRIVNDRSTDQTGALLQEAAANYPEKIVALSVLEKPDGISPKKHALTLARAEARGEIFVTTDADCLMGPLWLQTLVKTFDAKTGLVLGLTTYRSSVRPSTWESVIALEFASYAFVAAGLIGLGFPVHGNANNIAYRRRAWKEQTQILKHDHWVSGDDDFLLQGIHATGNWKVRYATEAESAVMTTPPDNFRHFWEQRKRWAGKCVHYQPSQVAFLVAVFAFYLSIFAMVTVGIFDFFWLPFGLGFFAWKTTSDWRVMQAATSRFGHPQLMRGFAGAAALHIPLIVAAVIAGSFGGFTWKGQKMRTRAG
jgi:cellulose synthase/poly-beta-1,6-N-acetylglucosamine synthase-like glycosyltransferase